MVADVGLPLTVHLLKLCVGIDLEELQRYQIAVESPEGGAGDRAGLHSLDTQQTAPGRRGSRWQLPLLGGAGARRGSSTWMKSTVR